MSLHVYVINGPGRSGKNTFIRMCRLFLRNSGYKVYSFSSILPIKKRMVEEGIWDGKSEKTTEIRRQMAEIKREMADPIDKPNLYLVKSIQELNDAVVFVHIREADSIKRFLKLLQTKTEITAKTIHYTRRDGTLQEFHSGVDLESQTREFDSYDLDIIVDKYGLDHLKDVVKAFLFGELNHIQVEDFDLTDLDNSRLHTEFDDELNSGFE